MQILHENFEVKSGSYLEQSSVLEVLGLDEFHKIQATNAIKKAFPGTDVTRKGSRNNRVVYYKDIGHKSYLHATHAEPVEGHLAISSGILNESSEIENINKLISTVKKELSLVNSRIDEKLCSNVEIQSDVLKAHLSTQANLQKRLEELHDILVKLLQKEVSRLSDEQSQCTMLGSAEARKLNEEIDIFVQYLNTNIQKRCEFNSMFAGLTENVEKNCPLLFNIIDTILLHRDVETASAKIRVKSAVHAIAILISLRSQKIKNDFKVIFTCLCISFGAGCRFIGMLNHLGLTVSWQTAMKFFDEKMKMQEEDLAKITPENVPVMLLIDNINIYRGKRKHLRVFSPKSTTMWNFTGQAVLLPQIEGLDEVFGDSNSCLLPQGDATKMTADDIFIEKDSEKTKLFDNFVDKYLTELLNDTLNKCPFSVEQLQCLSERELNSSLSTVGFKNVPSSTYNISVPSDEDILRHVAPPIKSNVQILPLSLEDNSTILGTMSILDNLSKTFNLPNEKKGEEYVPFDSTTGLFDITRARAHFELALSQKNYERHAQETVTQIRARDKAIDVSSSVDAEENEYEEEDQDHDLPGAGRSNVMEAITLENEKRRFENEDKSFWDAYSYVVQHQINATRSNSEEAYLNSVQNADVKEKAFFRDHLNRTLLHVAVEQNNKVLATYLVDVGLNVNDREGCGLTALSLAVLQKNKDLVELLVKYGAHHSGPLFTSLPSPLVMAKTMKLREIQCILEEDGDISDEEDFLIRQIDEDVGGSMELCNQPTDSRDITYNRTQQGFVTPLVGDVGTCKTNNAAMSRSASHHWVGICPGDLHNKGYFCEAVFKVHGPSGFHCLLAEVLKRKSLTAAVFKKKKFQEYNLVKVREAIRDCCRAYGLAAALAFIDSESFPVIGSTGESPDSNEILLKCFKEWLADGCESDVAFKHRATAFLLYGPLQDLYDAATAHGDGIARETVYQILTPIYAQLGFRNYYTEVFRHVVNFLVKWPKATRLILQKNSSINILGKNNHGIELDAYVEAEIVQPLKKYVTQHTSVSMCERLMGNLDMLTSIRRAYMAKDGFDVHPTSRHSIPSSLPDQFKGAWFCVKNGFFKVQGRSDVECYPVDNNCSASGKLTRNLLDVSVKGREKIKTNFEAKLYESFPDLRYKILTS